MKTADLTGPLLDYWVAKALGLEPNPPEEDDHMGVAIRGGVPADFCLNGPCFGRFMPSTSREQGGLIMERDGIGVLPATKEVPADGAYRRRTGHHFMLQINGWVAGYNPQTGYEFDWAGASAKGPTPLIAAMRAKVASVYGDEVPDTPTLSG